MHAHTDELAKLLTLEQGKPLKKARAEVTLAADWFRWTAELVLEPEMLYEDEERRIELHYKPLGVVAAITPWNFPLILAVCKIAPALLAGNTLILKPSPYTPLTSLRLGSILQECLPAGVFSVLSGGEALGEALISHSGIRKISFTGSIATGKRIAMRAGEDLKRLTLELGGNDPAILLDDAPIEKIAGSIFWGAMENSGQFCSAIKRVYVHTSQYAHLVQVLSQRANQMRVGNGMEEMTDLGPLATPLQLERVIQLVDEARAQGAKIHTGGTALPGPGYFYPPTILSELRDDLAIVQEEQFGPVIPVLAYDSIDEVITRANATMYGLGASVWSANPERAREVTHQLEAGTTWINTHGALSPHAPFGGAKWSGIGVEYGIWGVKSFTQGQVLHQRK
jgi:acyl-CoA reductase-like NAD-dependent aldehyde dehydrogenase